MLTEKAEHLLNKTKRQAEPRVSASGWRAVLEIDGAAHLDRCRAAIPWSIPSTRMSPSASGQCTPGPVPGISKFERCSGIATESRQDHARGTLIVRPSTSRAVIDSSVTDTLCIRESDRTTVLMPNLQKFGRVPKDRHPDPDSIRAEKPSFAFPAARAPARCNRSSSLLSLKIAAKRFTPSSRRRSSTKRAPRRRMRLIGHCGSTDRTAASSAILQPKMVH